MVLDGTSDEDPSSRRALRALAGAQGAAFLLIAEPDQWKANVTRLLDAALQPAGG